MASRARDFCDPCRGRAGFYNYPGVESAETDSTPGYRSLNPLGSFAAERCSDAPVLSSTIQRRRTLEQFRGGRGMEACGFEFANGEGVMTGSLEHSFYLFAVGLYVGGF